MLQTLGGQLNQSGGQPNRGLVREPSEHDVRHPIELVAHRPVQDRMAVAMDGTPPGRHPVDQLAPILQTQSNAGGGCDRQRRGAAGIGLYGCHTCR